ncbi:hypothetical protein MF271_06455 [Deinococcus sp. KNUC1210]|uniref:hypothetical protein n=1 Tax=Deinococcus sp. KNUC1210 TaxID=2917691 RepID=UPI001EF159AD|nr:hypothetical protein [Deinococcus sp. KNUC1210]ULH16245.1 hypothetical protein MF271_06455 [Deinococcus sp. KNUC1210]
MKRLPCFLPASRVFVPCLLTAWLTCSGFAPAFAAPRLGSHDTYTRLVFDLPAASTARSAFSSSGGNTVLTVTLQVPLKTERGTLLEPGVAAYATAGKTVTLQLASGSRNASVTVLPASGGQPNRLVIDVPFAPAKPGSSPVASPTGSASPSRVPALPKQPPAPVKVAAPVLTVVLDAGHGGVDSGMVSRWVTEKT